MQTNEQVPACSLGHMPEARWAFDESVTAVFTDMLSRSIPQYSAMRKCVLSLGLPLLRPNGWVVDLGCSRGDGLATFVEARGARNRYLGVEISKPMLAAARQRFQHEIEDGIVTIAEQDLRTGYPEVKADLTLCVLTLQFTPIEYRQRILRDVCASLMPGGAFLIVEKVLGASASLNERMVDLYHAFKRQSGYTAEEVERKRLSLEGVLVPVTAHWNEELLRAAGFREVDCFWRWMNFAGWIAIK
jgi:tRNA (cmo5U34)-methyltransferase